MVLSSPNSDFISGSVDYIFFSSHPKLLSYYLEDLSCVSVQWGARGQLHTGPGVLWPLTV